MPEERRRAPRIVCNGVAWVGHEGLFVRTELMNLSAVGVLIEGRCEDLPIGAAVTVRCTIGDARVEMEAAATVRHHRPGGLIALEFNERQDAVAAATQEAMATQAQAGRDGEA